jgi:hypothetical protein
MPAESRTNPETDADAAPQTGAAPNAISIANPAKWALRFITRV